MKKSLLILSLVAVSKFSQASTDPAKVPSIDQKREGDLAAAVAKFYAANNSVDPSSCEEQAGLPTYTAQKIDSGSVFEEKIPHSPITYDATYLALRICNTGSTFSGAYREAEEAVVIMASRTGLANDAGGINATQADSFKIVRKVDLKLLRAETGE